MNDFMRIILFFDLPVVSEKDKRAYTLFRTKLIKSGYLMLQYSVYSKICSNRDSAVKHIAKLKQNLPDKGSIRILMVTEKQYAKMEILIGGKSRQEDIITINPLIVL